MTTPKPHKLALIEWTHLIEDFLDNIGLTFDDFKDNMTGGWLFGYVEALKAAGVDSVLFCFSARVTATVRFRHQPTGAEVCILRAPALYRRIRKVIVNPYTQVVDEAVVHTNDLKRWWHSFLLGIAPYCTTPLPSLFRELRRHDCTAILCQDYEHARFDVCVLLGKLVKLPVFATFQGGNWQISRIEKWTRPFALKACCGLIVASGAEVARITKTYSIPHRKLGQIINPVDLSMWEGWSQHEARKTLGISAGKRVAVWHGRIDYYRKGLDVLIEAWETICLKNRGGDMELILLGSGVNADILQSRLEKSTATNITWINTYTNDRGKIQRYLKSADIYVFPSRNEGFPVAPLEAMACGLPLIASDAPGIVDILPLGEGSGGIIVQRDDPEALAAAISSLLDDTEKGVRLGRLAAENIRQNFSLQAVGDQLRNFIFNDGHK